MVVSQRDWVTVTTDEKQRVLTVRAVMAETYFTDPDNLETPFSWWAKLSGLPLIV